MPDQPPQSPDLQTARSPDQHMRRCLELAERGAGHVSPNPLVGSVIVAEGGAVLGEGWHQRWGGPHAEVHAIADAEAKHGADALRRATLYVNLEPCSHTGKTPPCADLILDKGIPRVVVGMQDPNPRVAGRGIRRLRDAGVDVTVGVEEAACRRLNAAFVHHLATGRPLVTLKIAQSLDGRTATRTGDSQWITGAEARARVHRWRARLDGVLVGTNTASADDPALSVRDPDGLDPATVRQPQRIVLDRTGRLAPSLRLFTDAYAAHTTVVTAPGTLLPYADALRARGGRIRHVPALDGRLDLAALLDALGRYGGVDGRPLQSLLVESGGELGTALLRHRLADRLAVFVAPTLIGTGRPSVGDLGITRLTDALTLAHPTWEPIGPDLLFRGDING